MNKKFKFVAMTTLCSIALASCGTAKETSTNATNTTTIQDTYKMKIASPTGAPGMALAGVAKEHASSYSSFKWIDTTTEQIGPYFAKGEVDAIVAPVNAGANMYTKNKNYKCAAVLTWGNLYFASKQAFKMEDITPDNTILFGEGSIPGMIADYILADYGVSIKNDETHPKRVVSGSNVTGPALLNDTSNNIYLVAEPILTKITTACKQKGETIYTVSVQEQYMKKTGSSTFPQAGLFVNAKTLENHKTVVDAFLEDVKNSCSLANTDASKTAQYAIELELLALPEPVLTNAIPRCAISYVSAKNAKADIEKIQAINPALFGGVALDDAFYLA